MQPASVAIDQIVYLASLESQPAELDVVLDPFRAITSRIDRQQPLSAPDAAILERVKQDLQVYLTTREKVRYFTPESLQLQLEQHFATRGTGGNRWRLLFVIGFSFVVATALAVGLPLQDPQQRGLVGGATLFALIHMGGAWFFLNALASFSSSLKKSFTFIAAGVTILGLSLLEQPIQEIFNLDRHPLSSFLFPIPILLASLSFFVGAMRYARIIGVQGRWVSFKPLFIMAVPLSFITWLLPLPHVSVQVTPLIAHMSVVWWAWITLTPIPALIYLPRAIRLLPELYKPPIRAFYQSLWAILAVTSYQYILRVVSGSSATGAASYISLVLVTVMGSMLLRAGYIFNKISRY